LFAIVRHFASQQKAGKVLFIYEKRSAIGRQQPELFVGRVVRAIKPDAVQVLVD
jgi:hypothetical protein